MIERNDRGRVDPSDPVAAGLLDALEAGPVHEVIRAAVDLGWWELALSLIAPSWTSHAYAEWHRSIMAWAMSLTPGEKPRPLVVCAPRGAGKSTVLSLALMLIAARRARSYALYVSNTARQTEDAVAGVGELLGSPMLAAALPKLAEQYRTEQGTARDWTKNRIRTGSGFTLDGIGLDQSMRGARIGSTRPDLILFDDIEDRTDSPKTTLKKRLLLTDSLIPAGSSDAAVVFVQNRIHDSGSDGIMAELIEGRADILSNAVVIGPVPMVRDLELSERTPTAEDSRRYVITGGVATWEGQSLEVAEEFINESGLPAFLRERQHEDVPADGGMFDSRHWRVTRDSRKPKLMGLCRSWDPAFTAGAGDWTAGVLIGIDQERRSHILDVIREQLDIADVIDLMEVTAERDSELYGKHVPVLVEDQLGGGKAFRREIERKLIGRDLHFVPTGGKSKEDRALAYASEVQRARVTLHDGDRPGRFADFVREHASFPNGRHDDQVDAAAQGFNWLAKGQKRKGSISRGAARATVQGVF